jgi:hypothetical protein
MNCLARPLSRLEFGCRRPPVPVWRSTGRMATRVAGRSAGCVMVARVPLVMRSGELPGVNQGSLSHNPRHCCQCIRLQSGLSRFLPLAGTRLVFTGMMGTRAGFIRGTIYVAIAFARCAAVLPKSDRWGFAPSSSAHVRWCEHGAPLQSCVSAMVRGGASLTEPGPLVLCGL